MVSPRQALMWPPSAPGPVMSLLWARGGGSSSWPGSRGNIVHHSHLEGSEQSVLGVQNLTLSSDELAKEENLSGQSHSQSTGRTNHSSENQENSPTLALNMRGGLQLKLRVEGKEVSTQYLMRTSWGPHHLQKK